MRLIRSGEDAREQKFARIARPALSDSSDWHWKAFPYWVPDYATTLDGTGVSRASLQKKNETVNLLAFEKVPRKYDNYCPSGISNDFPAAC